MESTDWAGAPLEGYARYAVYWAPRPESGLARAGAAWLGWDPATGASDPERAADPRVEAPRRYGLHATLKPPFRLAEGVTPAALDNAVAALAASLAPAEAPALAVDAALGFLSLRPAGPCPAIDHVAGACVERLDPLRAPLTDAERARRRPERLDAAARARLERWGYPHVFEGFRFHITLTGRLDPAEAEALRPVLAERFAPHIAGPFALDALCLFGDPGARENGTGGDGGAGFRLLRHHALAV